MPKKKETLIYGKPLIPNAGIKVWYTAQIKGLVRYMADTVSREVLKKFKELMPQVVKAAQDEESISSQERILLNSLAEEIEKLFKHKAGQIADTMIKKQRKYAKFSVRQSIGAAIGKDLGSYIFGGPTEDDIEKAVKMENVNLIRNLSQEYLMRVKGAVARSIINGQGQNYLKQELSRFEKMSLNRAARIAKDQTHKAYNALSLNEMKKEGVQYWQWIHGGGTKTVRPTHIKEHSKGGLNHGIFKIGELAYDPQAEKIKGVYKGRYIEPGELPFCSCFRRPVFKFD